MRNESARRPRSARGGRDAGEVFLGPRNARSRPLILVWLTARSPGGYHDQNHDGSPDHHPGGRRPSGGVRVDHGRGRQQAASPIPAGPPGRPRSSTTRAASPGGRARRSAAASGTPSAAATPRRSTPSWPTSPGWTRRLKRVVVHDGTGHSFWLAPNREPEKLAAAKIDWVFMVWQPASWERLRKLPADLNPTDPADTSPPSQIDVFTAGIDWADVTVPEGIEVVDQRLVAHGFTAEDGVGAGGQGHRPGDQAADRRDDAARSGSSRSRRAAISTRSSPRRRRTPRAVGC